MKYAEWKIEELKSRPCEICGGENQSLYYCCEECCLKYGESAQPIPAPQGREASEGEAATESKGCAKCKIETACIVAYLKGAPPCQTTRPTPEAKDWKPGQTVTIKPTRIEHFSMPPKTGTAPKECAHDYLPTGNILLSDPPQDEYRCSKCGAIKGVRLGTAPKEGQ